MKTTYMEKYTAPAVTVFSLEPEAPVLSMSNEALEYDMDPTEL